MYETNKNAIIQTRVTRNNKVRTETARRDWGADNFAVTTDSNNKTQLFADFDGGKSVGGSTVRFNGHQARTLYRLLQKHYKG